MALPTFNKPIQQGILTVKIMKTKAIPTVLAVLSIGIVTGGSAAAIPPTPAVLSPAAGASVLEPFTVSWSPVTDASGITAYSWEVSLTSSFATVISLGSTNGATQDTISGLANGKYFLRVQSLDETFTVSAWSTPQSFTVSGLGTGSLPAPVLRPTKAYSTFHPYEDMTFTWSPVAGAVTYVLQWSADPTFPIVTRGQFDNIPNPTMTFPIGNPEGSYMARVFAVTADRVLSPPSNLIPFSVFFTNPIGPPPSPLSPVGGVTVSLPIILSWANVPNPQPLGYTYQVAKDSSFKTIEDFSNQITDPFVTELTLTPGQKFWRVLSEQGDNTPTTPADTAWSATGTFTVSTAPPTPVSLTLTNSPLYSGVTTFLQMQLTAGVAAAGVPIALTSSNPAAFPVPATFTMPGNTAWAQLPVLAGQVTVSTPVTVTATINSQTVSITFNVLPPSLQSISADPSSILGGTSTGGFIVLNGEAPADGAVVALTSDSASAIVPATFTVPAGSFAASFAIATNPVPALTTANLTATWKGASVKGTVGVLPPTTPASITLNPSTLIGGSGTVLATVTLTAAANGDTNLPVTASNPAAAVPVSAFISGTATVGMFPFPTTPVATTTAVTISVTGGGVTRSAILTLTPSTVPQPALNAVTVSPTSVTGGSAAQGTVSLTAAAPAVGAIVTLSSSNSAAGSVPASVTVAAGATSATFAIATASVTASTPVTITASGGGASRTVVLTVTPGAPTATLTVTGSGKSGNNVTSSPAGISVPVGSTASASFTTGTSITLGVTNGRDAIWSGGCSSGGSKAKTCKFTFTGSVAVTANVQ
jgi:hypothetical protein